jgi:hypothetical protein
MHRTASSEDEARAQKADARDDLGRDTRGVQHDRAGDDHIGEAVLADQHDQRRRRADDGLCSYPALLP